MAVITQLGAKDVSEILSQYCVGDVLAYKEASEGIENTNYFVTTQLPNQDPTQFVVTLIEEISTQHSRDGMVKILDCCMEEGLPIPQLIRTQTGEPEAEFEGKAALLCTMLAGRHVANPLGSQCAAIGRFLGQFHSATETIKGEIHPYLRDKVWLSTNVQKLVPLLSPTVRSSLERTTDVVLKLLDREDTQSLPQSVIHADLFRDNALFNESGLSGVLDFHHAGTGYCIYDIAVAVNDWCRNGVQLDQERVIQLVRGYTSVRPLSTLERWLFPSFLIYGALAFWISRLMIDVREDLPSHYPIKDPNEFRQLVIEHQRHPTGLVAEVLS